MLPGFRWEGKGTDLSVPALLCSAPEALPRHSAQDLLHSKALLPQALPSALGTAREEALLPGQLPGITWVKQDIFYQFKPTTRALCGLQ